MLAASYTGMAGARHFSQLITWQLADALRVEVLRHTRQEPWAKDWKFKSQMNNFIAYLERTRDVRQHPRTVEQRQPHTEGEKSSRTDKRNKDRLNNPNEVGTNGRKGDRADTRESTGQPTADRGNKAEQDGTDRPKAAPPPTRRSRDCTD
jgi:hypothetical protein